MAASGKAPTVCPCKGMNWQTSHAGAGPLTRGLRLFAHLFADSFPQKSARPRPFALHRTHAIQCSAAQLFSDRGNACRLMPACPGITHAPVFEP
jgi:hypothetical protein